MNQRLYNCWNLFKIWKGKQSEKAETNIVVLRILLICSYLAAAAICTTLAYLTVHANEEQLFKSEFNSVSGSGLSSVENGFNRTKLGVQVLASTYSHLYPDSNAWPNVAWLGFSPTASLLSPVSSVDGLAILPIVQPQQLGSYENFLDQYYNTNQYVRKDQFCPTTFPNVTVWATDANGALYHDTTGETAFSPNNILTPIAQYTYSAFNRQHLGAYNMHSNPPFGRAIDKAVDCWDLATASDIHASPSCGQLSEVLSAPFPSSDNLTPETEDLVALVVFPIFPLNNASILTGFGSGTLSWKFLLTNVVPASVRSVECVVRTESNVFTMTIRNGLPTFTGMGDLHNKKYSEFGKSRVLHNTGVKVTFYPTEEFAKEYITNAPLAMALTFLVIFVFCVLVFAFYDVLMRREFSRHQVVLDTKRRFVRFISHEIRTPLNTVRMGLQLFDLEIDKLTALIGSTPLVDLAALITAALQNWTQLTHDILTNTECAKEVLDDLLNYDKIEVGTLRLEFSLFSFSALVKRVTSTMQIMAQQKEVLLQLTFDSSAQNELHAVIGDEARLAQVLRNLTSNALKFTPSGGKISLHVSCDLASQLEVTEKTRQQSEMFATHTLAGECRVSVQDTGAGLSLEQLAEICSEGVQFNANELQAGQGSGLGLFISKGIVEQHGGKLTVASEGLGKGVTFTVALPIYEVPRHKAVLLSRSRSNSISASRKFFQMHSTGTGAGCSDALALVHRALVVDDSHFNRKMVVRLLTARGFDCEQAEDGSNCLEVYTELQERGELPEVVLMDFEMPVMNGPAATKRLRELGCTCLIVGVTGNVLPDEVAFFKEQGADAVLHKPLVLEDLEKLIAGHRGANKQNKLHPPVHSSLRDDEVTRSFSISHGDQISQPDRAPRLQVADEVTTIISNPKYQQPAAVRPARKVHPLELV